MEALLNWASEHGAVCNVTTKADQPRKFFAAADISPGDVVFNLPTELLLHGSLALSDITYGQAFRALLSELGPEVCDQRSLLVLLLVLERVKDSQSKWAPYINMLPTQYDDPFWWSEADLQLLQGTRLQQAVQHYNRGLHQLHTWMQRLEQLQQQQQCGSSSNGLLSTALDAWGLTLDAVKWARSAVWSRAFTIRGLHVQSPAAAAAAGSSSAAVVALVPVLDMCDHHPEQRVTWRVVDPEQQQQCDEGQPEQQQQQQQQQQVFQFTTLKPVGKGCELFNNYGTTKPNEELLLGYGFVLEPNPHDSFLVSIANRTAAAAAAATDVASDAEVCSDDDDADSIAEACCEDAATWQQRLAIMAVAGLKLEVPITVANLLPQQLLDVLYVATAVPAWQLPQLLAAVTDRTSDSDQTQVQGLSKVSDPAAATSDHQQPHIQGLSKVSYLGLFAGATPDQKLQVLLQLKQQLTAKLHGMLPAQQLENLLRPLPDQTLDQQQQQGSGNSNPVHARLAAVYGLSQQEILRGALTTVSTAAQNVLLTLAMQANSTAAADVSSTANGSAESAQWGPGFSWCTACKTLTTSSSIATGSTVLQLPLQDCIVAASEQQLVVQLMLAAAGAPALQQQQYYADLWQQQQQFLRWWLVQQNEELVGVLQNIPLGQQLLDASEELQSDFHIILQQASNAAASNGHEQQQHMQLLVEVVRRDQATAFKLFCWARKLVQQGAVTLPLQQQQQQLVLVPGLEQVPKVLRDLVLHISLGHQSDKQPVLVVVTAACNLPAGLQLSSSSSSNGNIIAAATTCQQLLLEQGPAAVAAAAAAARSHSTLQHVYELVICPSEEDALRAAKLQLLAVTGLGLSHYLGLTSAPNPRSQQHQQQQQQQQHLQGQLKQVLTAMAVAMCDDDQLLQSSTLQQIAQQQQQALAAVTTGQGTAVSSTAAMLLDDTSSNLGTTAPAAVIGSVKHVTPLVANMTSDTSNTSAWQQLQVQLLKRYGKACRKQLKQVLATDADAVQAALQQLADVTAAAAEKHLTQQQAVAAQSVGCVCQRHCQVQGNSHQSCVREATVMQAHAGVREHLTGMAAVLALWEEQLQVYAGSGSNKAVGTKKQKGSGADNSEKKNKKAKKQRS